MSQQYYVVYIVLYNLIFCNTRHKSYDVHVLRSTSVAACRKERSLAHLSLQIRMIVWASNSIKSNNFMSCYILDYDFDITYLDQIKKVTSMESATTIFSCARDHQRRRNMIAQPLTAPRQDMRTAYCVITWVTSVVVRICVCALFRRVPTCVKIQVSTPRNVS